jgi:penicillin-binding protein 2
LDIAHYLYQAAKANTRLEYIFYDCAPEQLKEKKYVSYGSSDFLGKEGIEQSYESSLRGVDGKELIEVDAMGKPVRKLGVTDPLPGKDITTTIDADLQKATYEAMSTAKKGSVIVSTPKGQILALVSKPSFDPNLFTLGKNYTVSTTSGYQHVSDVLLDGENQPLLDRSIAGTYPPGSTFKLVTALAGLENNIIDKSFSIQDSGILKLGTFSFGNWYYLQYGKTDGTVDVIKAIKRSNDIFFYTLAQKVGVDRLSATARQFGVGQVLGIDLAGEAKGIVPTQKWKQEYMKEQWYLGDTYHYGIGQGYLLTTPLQVNEWTQVIANGGTVYRPRLVEKNQDPIIAKVPIQEESLRLVRQGMIESCAPGGVAWPLFQFTVQNATLKIDGKNILEAPVSSTSAKKKNEKIVTVACKTGTAQHGDEHTKPHAWITLFAPAYNPEIVVTVIIMPVD